MQDLFNIILPVFLVIGVGYAGTRGGYMSRDQIDGLMKYTQNFAIPCLLFTAIARLDLSQSFDWRLLTSFYVGAGTSFVLAMLGTRFLFKRGAVDSVAIGFIGLFSNSVLLGLAITERAYGVEALASNFAIVSIHAPFCYFLGITVMEVVRGRASGSGQGLGRTALNIGNAMFRNALVVALALGFIVNLTGLVMPEPAQVALDLIARTALPAALFGLGGVLVRYRLDGDLRVMGYVLSMSLIVHPALVITLGTALGLSDGALRSAVVTAAMAPGINTYLFASIYGVGQKVAASSVLIGTAASILTVWGWLQLLP
jgi:predicted permease